MEIFPAIGGTYNKNQEFKVILGYAVSSVYTWAAWDLVSQKTGKTALQPSNMIVLPSYPTLIHIISKDSLEAYHVPLYYHKSSNISEGLTTYNKDTPITWEIPKS